METEVPQYFDISSETRWGEMFSSLESQEIKHQLLGVKILNAATVMTPGKDRLLTIILIWQPWDVGDVAHTAGVVCHWHVQFWSWKIFYASTLISIFFWLVLLDCHDKETLPRQLANVKLQPLSELLVDRPWLFVKTDVSVFNPHIKFSQGLVVNFYYDIR